MNGHMPGHLAGSEPGCAGGNPAAEGQQDVSAVLAGGVVLHEAGRHGLQAVGTGQLAAVTTPGFRAGAIPLWQLVS